MTTTPLPRSNSANFIGPILQIGTDFVKLGKMSIFGILPDSYRMRFTKIGILPIFVPTSFASTQNLRSAFCRFWAKSRKSTTLRKVSQKIVDFFEVLAKIYRMRQPEILTSKSKMTFFCRRRQFKKSTKRAEARLNALECANLDPCAPLWGTYDWDNGNFQNN